MSTSQLQSYLTTHQLPSLFSSLLQTITISRPEDPISFIIAQLRQNIANTGKILVLGNFQNEKLVGALRAALETGREISPLSYITLASQQNLSSRLSALQFQQRGLSPDILVWCHITDYNEYLRVNSLDSSVYSVTEFQNDNFTQLEMKEVFQGGAALVDCSNETNELRVLGRVVHRVMHRGASSTATPRRIAITGAPGVGCSSHARRVASVFNVPRLEPQEVAIAAANEAGADQDASSLAAQAHKALDANQPLADSLINELMLQRISQPDCAQGYILDGYPRNKAQCDFVVQRGLVPELAVVLKATPEVSEARIKGRQIHAESGDIYHETHFPADSQVNLVKRPQDSDEGRIRAALRAYKTDEDSILQALHGVVRAVDAQDDQLALLQHRVANACFDEPEGVEKIIIVGAPLSRVTAIAEEVAKARGLTLVNGHTPQSGTTSDYERTSAIVKKLRASKQGWVLSEFPSTVEQAELLLQSSILPTHIIVLKLTREQAKARAKHTTEQERIQNAYFQYVTNRDAILNQFRPLQLRFKTFNAAQLLPKLSQDVACFLEGKTAPLRLIFAGAPASGKGTQCELIRDKYNLVHLSTGDMLRDAVRQKTELGLEAVTYMNKGKLVPDRLIEGIVAIRLNMPDCQERGWLLDGFPRTEAQAQFLVKTNNCADAVILLQVPDEVVVGRISGRRTDPVTGNTYHVDYAPPPAGEIASRVVQRSDDTEEKVRVRLQAYHENLSGILTTFGEQIFRVDGDQKKEVVSASIVEYIEGVVRSG